MDPEPYVPAPELVAAVRERLSTLVDSRPGSATYGCADREYWCYGLTRSFPGSTFQAAAFLGALAPAEPWARESLERWVSYQNADGSSSEWFEGERSFCATAHTGCYALEAALVLDPGLSSPWAERVVAACGGAAGWLARQPFPSDSNQVAAAGALFARLYALGRVHAAGRWLSAALARLDGLRSPEGWFAERGGLDPGYASLTLALLARAWEAVGWDKLRVWCRELEALLLFLLPFLEPSPWEAWSRETAFLLPLVSEEGLGRWGATSHGRWLGWDDRYLCFFAAPSLALAVLRQRSGAIRRIDGPSACAAPLETAGGTVFRSEGLDRVVLGLSKGGTVRCHQAGRPRLDLGYAAASKDGQVFATLGAARWWAPAPGRDEYRVVAPFRRIPSQPPLGRLAALLPAVARWVVPGPWAAPFSRWARRRGAARPLRAGLSLERRIRVETHSVVVDDRLEGPLGALEEVSLCRGGPGGFAPAARQGPEVGRQGWCREGLDPSDARRLLAGKSVSWREVL